MPLGVTPSTDDSTLAGVLGVLTNLWSTVGFSQDENDNPVKYATDDELDKIADLLAKGSKAASAEKKARS